MSMRFNVVPRELLAAIAPPQVSLQEACPFSDLQDLQPIGEFPVYRDDRSSCPPAHTSRFWNALLDVLPAGVMVLSKELDLVYTNPTAQAWCQHLTDRAETNGLPIAIQEIGNQLIQTPRFDTNPLIVELTIDHPELSHALTLRIRAFWFHLTPGLKEPGLNTNRQFMILFLENRKETLHEERLLEQQKYELTDREAEIWHLLRQDYSYQDIAKTLQISLNTVKTHIKNVYAKRRSYHGQSNLIMI